MEDPDKRRGLPLQVLAANLKFSSPLPPDQQAAFEKVHLSLQAAFEKVQPSAELQAAFEQARLQAPSSECSRIFAQALQYQKDLLRRLGVRTDLEDREEFWVQMIAAAHVVGVSEKEFWNKTPRELCAILEHRATELDLLRGRDAPPEPSWDGKTRAAELASTKPQQSTTPSPEDGRKRGPKSDHEGAARVAEIVARLAPEGGWKDKLDRICTALDTDEIPYPKTWPKRDLPLNSWEDGATLEPVLAKKAIEDRLKLSKRPKKFTLETLP